jgi:CRISPR-associated protein Cmr4
MADYKQQRFLLMTLDPVHVGTGGYRLGRVDLSIVREPGTQVPKLVGTGLSGAARSYAAYRYGKPDCAGKGGPEGKKHCRLPTCPICYTFGYATGEAGGHAGTVNLFDAHLLLCPVHSMAGPVWMSTVARLEEAGFEVQNAAPSDEEAACTLVWDKPLNLGWLMLKVKAGAKVGLPKELKQDEGQQRAWEAIQDRIVLVTEKLFSQIVNSNLEVRTSVSIDPFTGAAETGALFTYEAIPRAAWLVTDVVMDDYRNAFPSPGLLKQWLGQEGSLPLTNEQRQRLEKAGWTDEIARQALERYTTAGLDWDNPTATVKAGLKMAELLGVGGMGTRGFGRVKLMDDWDTTPKGVK